MSTELQKLADVIAQNNIEMKSVMTTYAESVTKADSEIKSLTDEMKAIKAANEADVIAHKDALAAEIESRRKLEAKMGRLPGVTPEGDVVETLGKQFINSPEFKNFLANPSIKTSAAYEAKAALSNPTPIMNAPLQQTNMLGLVMPHYQPYHMRDLLAVVQTSQPNVEWLRETIPGGFTNNAAIVQESGLKPESFFEFEEKITSVKTLATYSQITNQMLADNPQLSAYIDTRLRFGLALKEDAEVLYGTGGVDSLDGIKYTQGVQTFKWSDGDPDDNMMDALLNAMVKSMLSFYTPTGIVMNPKDMAKVRKAKSSIMTYLYETTSGQPSTIWGLPVVESVLMSEGEALVGNFNLACTLYDRETLSLRVGEPGDSFLRNKKSILLEERLALVTTRPNALVWTTLDAAPAS